MRIKRNMCLVDIRAMPVCVRLEVCVCVCMCVSVRVYAGSRPTFRRIIYLVDADDGGVVEGLEDGDL